MAKFIVEIQSCAKIRVEADNKEDARMKVVDDIDLWHALLIDPVIGDAISELNERDKS